MQIYAEISKQEDKYIFVNIYSLYILVLCL